MLSIIVSTDDPADDIFFSTGHFILVYVYIQPYCVTKITVVNCFWQAAILQQTADYIYRLEQEKTTLLNQVVQLKRLLKKYEKMEDSDSPSPKRRKRADSMMDEGIGSPESLEDAIPSNRVSVVYLLISMWLDQGVPTYLVIFN